MEITQSDLEQALKTFARELRQPDAITAAKQREEEVRKLEKREQVIRNAYHEEQSRLRGQQMCSHKKRNGQTLFAGQPNQDGYIRYMCLGCQKVMPPVKATQEQLTGGVNAQDANNAFMWNLDEKTILQWVEWTNQNHPLPKVAPRSTDISALPPEGQAAILRLREQKEALLASK